MLNPAAIQDFEKRPGDCHKDSWPVRFRICTLGRFDLRIDDRPLATTRLARKPLEVLKALVGLGPGEVSLATLSDELWPELDGAASHNACHVAIHRLRKMLGDVSVIRVDHGTVAVSETDAWVDVDAFRRLTGHIRARLASGRCSQSELVEFNQQLMAAYPGHFLPGEDRPWAIAVREPLRTRFVHLASDLSAALERSGAVEAAIALNRHGIARDPLAENFHRALIQGLIRLHRKAEALEAFRHCRETLLAGLRVEPSPETYALHALIRRL